MILSFVVVVVVVSKDELKHYIFSLALCICDGIAADYDGSVIFMCGNNT